MLERIDKKYSVDEIKDFYNLNVDLKNQKKKMMFDGHLVKVYSQRYQLFFTKGVVCCNCKVKGEFFYKEKDQLSKSYHFNLYGVDNNGDEILITKDHIIPRSKGGQNTLRNYQTMCTICNQKKGCVA